MPNGETGLGALHDALAELQREKMALAAELERYRQVLSALTEVASLLGSDEQPPTILNRILEIACQVTEAEAGSILLLTKDGNKLAFLAATGPVAQEIKGFTVSIGSGVAGWVAQTAQPVIIDDARLDAHFFGEIDAATGFQTRSILCVPVKAKGGLIGVAELINKQPPMKFDRDDLQAFQSIVSMAALLIDSARLR